MMDEGARVSAGWYPDPERSDLLRYWDGSNWVDHWWPVAVPATVDSTPTGEADPANAIELSEVAKATARARAAKIEAMRAAKAESARLESAKAESANPKAQVDRESSLLPPPRQSGVANAAQLGGNVLGCLLPIAFLFLAFFGITYIPLVRDTVPSIAEAPAGRVDLTLDGVDPTSTNLPPNLANKVKDKCDDVPFFWRPFATRRSAIVAVYHYNGVAVGEATYSCSNGAMTNEKQY